LTPEVFPLLELEPTEYRTAGLTLQEFTAFHTGVFGRPLIETRYPRVVSYAIRRCEFDDFLLRRAAVRVLDDTRITTLRRTGGAWLANERIEAPVVIGAGGHFCPVARHVRGARAAVQPIVAREAELLLDGGGRFPTDAAELFFCEDLEGYAWLVPKGPYVNIGIGRRGNRAFNEHLARFMVFLEATGRLPCASRLRWRGHAYVAAGVGATPLVDHGLLLIGDSAGLAYPESGEGIRPAIESARLAAQALIDAGGHHGPDDLRPYADAIRRQHPPARRYPAPVHAERAALGRGLLGSPKFARRVLLDQWFLRT
jgi:menaquinone-9 beta-reductase